MDHGHELAEESLKALEREYARIYGQAAREMKAKQEKALKKYQGELSQRLKALDDSDPEAVKRHEAWLAEQAMTQQWVGVMSDELSARATNANVLAMDALHDHTPRVYAENANWAAYDIDRKIGYDTTFTLVDEDTVRNLIMNGGSTEAVGSVYRLADGTASTAGGRLLPEITLSLKERMFPHVDEERDYIWNRRRFHTAITQGIIQGESIPNIVKRLDGIFGSNMAAATRAARTATTCAENAGRISSYQRAQGMGIKLKQEWLAALDTRTRSSHRMLDGQKVEIGGKFQAERGELRFPGDPLGHPAETYNCRCTLVADVDGVDQEDAERWSRLPKGMTYEEWKAGKTNGATAQTAPGGHKVVDGKDILGTWHRRPDEFDFEIEDVMAAQGFDGKPRVVAADEFDRAVREANGGNGLIMQRTYSASDQETLNSYREQLYGGKWYVDCSEGGSAFGRGMYTVSAESRLVTQQMEDAMRHYARETSYTETMTLDASAKTVEYSEIASMKKDRRNLDAFMKGAPLPNDFDRRLAYELLGTSEFAALLGYDAVIVPDMGYTVVLNRTKLIIRRPE